MRVVGEGYLFYVLLYLQSNIIVIFREEKPLTDELKAWEFWHSRQHSVKHRILDIGESTSEGYMLYMRSKIHHSFHSIILLILHV